MRERGWKIAGAAVATAALAAGAVVLAGAPAGAAKPLARATLQNASGAVVGEVVFKGYGSHVDRATVTISVPPDAPGLGAYHGLHVHTTGSCSPDFLAAGGHWNPTGTNHGHHVGDLPSVLISTSGRAYMEVETSRFAVNDLFDGDGSAVILHVGPDNFANIPSAYGAPNAGTLATGDAGGRYACGVVTP